MSAASVNESVSLACQHGTIAANGSSVCFPYFEGVNCSSELILYCLNGGSFLDDECAIPFGFTGQRCCERICFNGGRIDYDSNKDNNNWRCICPTQFRGEHCELPLCTDGKEYVEIYEGKCVCPIWYDGESCEHLSEYAQIAITAVSILALLTALLVFFKVFRAVLKSVRLKLIFLENTMRENSPLTPLDSLDGRNGSILSHISRNTVSTDASIAIAIGGGDVMSDRTDFGFTPTEIDDSFDDNDDLSTSSSNSTSSVTSSLRSSIVN